MSISMDYRVCVNFVLVSFIVWFDARSILPMISRLTERTTVHSSGGRSGGRREKFNEQPLNQWH